MFSGVIYEVNLTIQNPIYNDYLEWLKPHIQEILHFKGFTKAEIVADFEKDAAEPDFKHITVHYRLTDRESLQDYFDNHATKMREDGKKRFGEHFSAQRRVLTSLHSF